MLTGGLGRGLVALLGRSRVVGACTASRVLTLRVAGGKVAILGGDRVGCGSAMFAAVSAANVLIAMAPLVAIEVVIVIVVWVIL